MEKPGGYEKNLSRRVLRAQEYSAKKVDKNTEDHSENASEQTEFQNKLLSNFKVEELKASFIEYLKKSGVPVENANTPFLSNISFQFLGPTSARYNPLNNELYFSNNSENYRKALALYQEQKTIPQEYVMDLAFELAHEAAHGFSRIRLETKDIANARVSTDERVGYSIAEAIVRRSGRPEKSNRREKYVLLFQAFNEGVTERIAYEILCEYMRRAGLASAGEKYIAESLETRVHTPDLYFDYMIQIDGICDRIAHHTGVPKEQVWNAVKRGYFEDPQYYDSDVQSLFKETFGDDFLVDYAHLKTSAGWSAVSAFNSKYGLERDLPGLKKTILDYLHIQQ